MKRTEFSPGVYTYQTDAADRQTAALVTLAKIQAEALEDDVAAQVAALFPAWQEGAYYEAGVRVTDDGGALYRVVQAHTAQADWPVSQTPALYLPLGIRAENPEETPPWRQPTGAHDAYSAGDCVRYEGGIYESKIDANVYAPSTEFWRALEAERES